MTTPVYKEFMGKYKEAYSLVRSARKDIRKGRIEEAKATIRKAEEAMPSEQLLRLAKEAAPRRMGWNAATYDHNHEVHLRDLYPMILLQRLKGAVEHPAKGQGRQSEDVMLR